MDEGMSERPGFIRGMLMERERSRNLRSEIEQSRKRAEELMKERNISATHVKNGISYQTLTDVSTAIIDRTVEARVIMRLSPEEFEAFIQADKPAIIEGYEITGPKPTPKAASYKYWYHLDGVRIVSSGRPQASGIITKSIYPKLRGHMGLHEEDPGGRVRYDPIEQREVHTEPMDWPSKTI